MEKSQSIYNQPHSQKEQWCQWQPVGNRNKPLQVALQNLVQEDAASFENLHDKEGVSQDVELAREEPNKIHA